MDFGVLGANQAGELGLKPYTHKTRAIPSRELIPDLEKDCEDLKARLELRQARLDTLRGDWPDIHTVWSQSPWALIRLRMRIDLFIYYHAIRHIVGCQELICGFFWVDIVSGSFNTSRDNSMLELAKVIYYLMLASIPWTPLVRNPVPNKGWMLWPNKLTSKRWPEVGNRPLERMSLGDESNQLVTVDIKTPFKTREELYDAQLASLLRLNTDEVPW